MSKKSNKKSLKKKLSKKPGAKKIASKKTSAKKKKVAKKPAKKPARPKKKAAARKTAPKKGIKKVARPLKKKMAAKAAPKKALKKSAKKIATRKSPVKKIAIKKPAAKIPVKKTASPEKVALKVLKSNPQPVTPKRVVEKPVGVKQDEHKVVRVVKQVTKGDTIATPRKSVIIDIKTGPEPAGRFELEYVVHASAQILFEFLTTPSGLSEWFCDDVNIRNGVYSFKWDENEQNARVVKLIEEKLVRFQWVDKNDNSYFEFRIERDDLTNDISLIIVDFAETPEEKASSTLLWNSQIDKLLHVLGAYF